MRTRLLAGSAGGEASNGLRTAGWVGRGVAGGRGAVDALEDGRGLGGGARGEEVGLVEDVGRERFGRTDGRIGEEGVLEHLVERQARRRVGGENGADEHARLMAHEPVLDGEAEVVLTNVLVGALPAAAVVRRLYDEERVGDDADRPDVHFVGVRALPLRFQDLRSDVVRRPAHRLLALVRLAELRGQTEIAHFHVQIVIQEDVAQLQVSMDDTAVVQVFYSVDDLEQEILNLGLGQVFAVFDQVAQCLQNINFLYMRKYVVRT